MDLKQNNEKVMELIGYQFNNKDLLYQAFKRKSYVVDHGGESNELLEFIGDTILEYCVINIFTREFMGISMEKPKELYSEGNLTEFNFTEYKQDLTSNEYLAGIVDKLGLAGYMYLGDADKKNNVVNTTKVKADLIEAIIGAMAIDSNYDMKKIVPVVEKLLDSKGVLKAKERIKCYVDSQIELNEATSKLKELVDKRILLDAKYSFDNKMYDIDGWKMWKCKCIVTYRKGSKTIQLKDEGYGTTKVEAKKDVSLNILKKLNLRD